MAGRAAKTAETVKNAKAAETSKTAETSRTAETGFDYLDARLPAAEGSSYLRKVFPDHWSFLLGELALYSLILLLLTGTFLTFFFHPGETEIRYTGSYLPLRGQLVSGAY